MSSARAVRCRLKCHNERNPDCQLPACNGGHSGETAVVRCEEGRDDVKSARPLRPGLHTCYNGGYRGMLPRERWPIRKSPPSSDWSLQPDSTKLDSLVIAHQPWRGEYVPVAVPEGAAGTPPFWSGRSLATVFLGLSPCTRCVVICLPVKIHGIVREVFKPGCLFLVVGLTVL